MPVMEPLPVPSPALARSSGRSVNFAYDTSTAKTIELMLKSESLNIFTTELGEDGVDLAKLSDYDIIVLDLPPPPTCRGYRRS